MKNLLTYISPIGEFNGETKILARIQIENSLDLGWKPEDIMLITNFPYEYQGVSATVIKCDYCSHFFPATKIYAIMQLFKMGMITDELYWYHDFDCYQLHPITEEEIGDLDLGLAQYSRMPRLCSASMFFRKGARTLFKLTKRSIEDNKIDDERAIMRQISKYPDIANVKIINNSYAFHRFNIRRNWSACIHPIRAVHFHPGKSKFDFFMYGQNKLGEVIFPERLTKLFEKYGYDKNSPELITYEESANLRQPE